MAGSELKGARVGMDCLGGVAKPTLGTPDSIACTGRAAAQRIMPSWPSGVGMKSTMIKQRLWEKLHLSQWGRVKALADHLGFKIQRLKGDQCLLLMPNVEVNDTSLISSLPAHSPISRLVAQGRRGKILIDRLSGPRRVCVARSLDPPNAIILEVCPR